MTEAASPTVAKENKRNNHKLTRVVSTKLSIEDDDFLQQLTDKAYQVGAIKERSKSKLLRLIITLVSSELRNRPDLFFTLISRKERTRANFQGCDQYTFIDYFSQEGKEVKLVMEVQRGR